MTPSNSPRDSLAGPRREPGASRSRALEPSRARVAMTARSLARRRILVRLARWLLPLAALALLAAVALWPEFEGAEDRGRLAFRRAAQTSAEAMRISNARYQGLDEQNRPYNVTADTAVQQEQTELIDLTRPRADLLMNDGAWVLLESREGRYDKARNMLDLNGDVTLWHDDGSTLRTAAATIDIGAGSAAGDRPVAAQGPFGTLVSEGFRLRDRGQVVLFTGQARAVLEGGR
ncbi:LPS export ABC transporter periplasmic protein LptC [Roseomonas sp. KE0001]|uniref:LPS export ABC transporter periplasmic protein LptC n=1 Tax=unclassified Roseomonas TaxID=2617492 RepID=UPI00351C9F9F